MKKLESLAMQDQSVVAVEAVREFVAEFKWLQGAHIEERKSEVPSYDPVYNNADDGADTDDLDFLENEQAWEDREFLIGWAKKLEAVVSGISA
ncbi:hypothetical protein [Streptomyces sp. NPDC056883]|uniref:hypothetical protein n=1 Tax=Streptomyces sp. NPDC056883 TaxID=3345959 RepID=UPI0036A259C7